MKVYNGLAVTRSGSRTGRAPAADPALSLEDHAGRGLVGRRKIRPPVSWRREVSWPAELTASGVPRRRRPSPASVDMVSGLHDVVPSCTGIYRRRSRHIPVRMRPSIWSSWRPGFEPTWCSGIQPPCSPPGSPGPCPAVGRLGRRSAPEAIDQLLERCLDFHVAPGPSCLDLLLQLALWQRRICFRAV